MLQLSGALNVGLLVFTASAIPLGCVEQQLQLDTPTGTEV